MIRELRGSPDGRQIAAGNNQHIINLWSATTGTVLQTINTGAGAVTPACTPMPWLIGSDTFRTMRVVMVEKPGLGVALLSNETGLSSAAGSVVHSGQFPPVSQMNSQNHNDGRSA
jgi:hypothetical protein